MNTTDIVTFKLISGDEVIGKEVERTNDWILIHNPLIVAPNGQSGLVFIPAMFSAAPTTPIPFLFNGMAVYPVEAGSEFSKVYVEKTSGLILS